MSDTIVLPEYGEIDETLSSLRSRVDAPESHGILCGMISAGGRCDDRDWMAQVVPDAGKLDGSVSLQALYDATLLQLDDPQMSFQPLLPGEDADLALRTEALAHWCSGFLYGLGLGGVTEATQLPGEAAEVLGDIAKIASVDYEVEEPGEEEERAYAEVVEYVRVGALLVFESLRGPGESDTVH